jgi:hypothetical protein
LQQHAGQPSTRNAALLIRMALRLSAHFVTRPDRGKGFAAGPCVRRVGLNAYTSGRMYACIRVTHITSLELCWMIRMSPKYSLKCTGWANPSDVYTALHARNPAATRTPQRHKTLWYPSPVGAHGMRAWGASRSQRKALACAQANKGTQTPHK